MNQRNVCIVGLAAVVTVLAGCAAQYRNPGSCVAQMHDRLDETQHGKLTITNRAVSYRGQRVVIEGRLDGAMAPASAASASTAVAASGAAAAAPSSAAQAKAQPQPHPTTPVGALVAHFTHFARPHKTTSVAAECTFDESGLTSFRWLAPAALAKTTPAPARSN